MMKRINKYIYFVFIITLLVSVYFIKNSSITYAETASVVGPTSTFKTNYNGTTVNYVLEGLTAAGVTNDNSSKFAAPKDLKVDGASTPLYVLSRNMSVPGSTEQFEIISGDTPKDLSDNGLMYIVSHGYNTINTTNNVFTGNTYGSITATQKQYVTQAAIWLYLYEHKTSFTSTYCANNSCELASDARSMINSAANGDGFEYLKYITDLVDSANNYTGRETSSISALNGEAINFAISDDSKLLVTKTITPSSTSNTKNYMYFSLELSDPNEYGAYITNTSGTKITNLSMLTSGFRVVVPLKEKIEDMDLRSVTVTVTGHYIYNANEYRVTTSTNGLLDASKNQKYSNIILGALGTETVKTSFPLYNIVKISKIDITDSKELPGAKIKITKKSNDEVVEEYTSTDIPHYIYLANGDYKLCETAAPDGYELNTECIDFSVDGTKIVAVTMKNKPVEIPDTGLFGSNLLKVIGAFLLITGSLFILKMTRHNDNTM